MACLFNNIRGFRAPVRVSQLADLIKDQRADMLCFQETIKQDFSPSELHKLTGGFSFHWHMVPARGHSGGLLMG
jgi:exonuclease III